MRPKRADECPCCGQGRFDFLESKATAWTTTLCGRNAVQVSPKTNNPPDLIALKAALSKVTKVHDNGFLLTFRIDGCEITLFPDGRAVIKGTMDESTARGLYAKYIGG